MRLSRKTKALLAMLIMFVPFLFISIPYQEKNGWSMVELIINIANWLRPSLQWDYTIGHKIEGYVLGNLYIVAVVALVVIFILLIKSLIHDKDKDSPELVAIKELGNRIDNSNKQMIEVLNKILEKLG